MMQQATDNSSSSKLEVVGPTRPAWVRNHLKRQITNQVEFLMIVLAPQKVRSTTTWHQMQTGTDLTHQIFHNLLCQVQSASVILLYLQIKSQTGQTEVAQLIKMVTCIKHIVGPNSKTPLKATLTMKLFSRKWSNLKWVQNNVKRMQKSSHLLEET